MLSTILADGIGVVVQPAATARRRIDQGLSRELYVRTLALTAAFSLIGLLVPELTGVNQAMDQVSGATDDGFELLSRTGLIGVALVVGVPAAVIAWRGPRIAARLSAMAGGSSDPFAAAVWIYLGTAASLAITVAVAVADLIAGALTLVSEDLAGWIAFAVAAVATLLLLAVAATLARIVLAVPGPVRAVLFTAAWLLLALAIGLSVGLPVLSWME